MGYPSPLPNEQVHNTLPFQYNSWIEFFLREIVPSESVKQYMLDVPDGQIVWKDHLGNRASFDTQFLQSKCWIELQTQLLTTNYSKELRDAIVELEMSNSNIEQRMPFTYRLLSTFMKWVQRLSVVTLLILSIFSCSNPVNSQVQHSPYGTNMRQDTILEVDLPERTQIKLPTVDSPYESVAFRTKMRQKRLDYVKRFLATAKAEQDKFGIPASILLAQGLIQSNVGESNLALTHNNHFGIRKTWNDHSAHMIEYVEFATAWESWRANSILLSTENRYAFLKKYSDYRSWAYGLVKAGYVVDEKYAQKLIYLIEDLELYSHDQKPIK